MARLRRRLALRLAGLAALALASPGQAGPGRAVVLVQPERVVALAEGGAEIAPDGTVLRPMGVDTPVRIASVSKLFVALAVLRLVDAGRLSLGDSAEGHLGWSLRHPLNGQAITIAQLLEHRSGLSDAGGYVFPLGVVLREALNPKHFGPRPPGAAFDYANLNSVVLASVIEAVTGERFDQAMQRLVLKPLGLDACFNWSGCRLARAGEGAVVYRRRCGVWTAEVDAQRPRPCPVLLAPGVSCEALDSYRLADNGGLFSPQGGLRISVTDLARAGQQLLDAKGGFLSPALHDLLFQSRPIEAMGDGPESNPQLMRGWSAGGLHCLSGDGRPGGDQPLAPRPLRGCGHLGAAYGLRAGLMIDLAAGQVLAWAMAGEEDPPAAGRVSRLMAGEEEWLARVFQ